MSVCISLLGPVAIYGIVHALRLILMLYFLHQSTVASLTDVQANNKVPSHKGICRFTHPFHPQSPGAVVS